jgi:peptidoglycan L-alanyl-D-glutamate endopeptidase CwlK
MAWRKNVNKDELHPILVMVMDEVLARLERSGQPFKVYSGLRTWEQQAELYTQGRETVGAIVTKAKPGQSMHNYGLAVDLAPFNLVTPNEDDLWWPDLAARAGIVWYDLEKILLEVTQDMYAVLEPRDLDIEWGGRWQFRDVPHVQIRTSLRELQTGFYPLVDVDWLVASHTTFLFGTEWMNRRVQYLLNELGYNVGPVDGDIGPRTREGIAKSGGTKINESLVENLLRRRYGS